MKLLNRLPGFVPVQPGFERIVLRAIPSALAVGLVILWHPMLIRAWNTPLASIQPKASLSMEDIYTFGFMLCYFNLLVAITIGAIIVMLMKGPAFVADPYPLSDAERPATTWNLKDDE